MLDQIPTATVQKIDAREVYSQLRKIAVFSELREEDADCLGEVELVHLPRGSYHYRDDDEVTGFWGVVEGEIRAYKKEADGSSNYVFRCVSGDSYGEVPLLSGHKSKITMPEMVTDTTLIHVGEEGFWRLMST